MGSVTGRNSTAHRHGHCWRKALGNGQQRGERAQEERGPGNHFEAGDVQQWVWVCAHASPVGMGWEPAPYSKARYDEEQKVDMK